MLKRFSPLQRIVPWVAVAVAVLLSPGGAMYANPAGWATRSLSISYLPAPLCSIAMPRLRSIAWYCEWLTSIQFSSLDVAPFLLDASGTWVRMVRSF